MRTHRQATDGRALGTGLVLCAAMIAPGCASLGSDPGDQSEPAVFTETTSAAGDLRADLPEGARIVIEVDRALSSDGSSPGDPWRGTVTEDVTDGSRVLLTRGAVVSGVVTRAGPMEIEGETRHVIALEPRTLEVGDRSYHLDAEVVDAEAEARGSRVTGENIAIVGGSAAAGAILGEILFDEALLGALLGAAGGTVVAIATEDTEIDIEEGSELTLRLRDEVQAAQARR